MSAKFRMVSNGKVTYMELDGKTIGSGVKEVRFSQHGIEESTLQLSIDLEDFKFMKDGLFDEAQDKLMTAKPPEQNAGRTE